MSVPGRALPELGDADVAALAGACAEMRYTGYIGIECLPLPDEETAARHAARVARLIASATAETS